MFSASRETRDRNAPTNANQIRLQTSRIRQEHRPIRYQLPARLSFRQGNQPVDARKARLWDIVHETGAKTIHYLYDFGDSWNHVIKLEKWFDDTPTEGLPLLLDAIGRGPPEDVGGAPGYAEYLQAISDPAHPEHEHMCRWGPERFDPNVVDRAELEAAVNALSEKWKPRRRTRRSK